MQFIRDIFANGRREQRPIISFEFFPPRTEPGERYLIEETIPQLSELRPDYCSVTYGAGGSTRDKTLEIVHRIQDEHELTAMSHLTCVSATRADLATTLERARALGIRNILALRGDPPSGADEFTRTDGGFEYSYQLIDFVRTFGGFSVGTAGFPEGHIDCRAGKYQDWAHLKSKIERGADFVLTQLFYDNADFLHFRDYLTSKLHVTVPISAGILPILSTRQIKRFVGLCGATIPPPLLARLEALGDDDEAVTTLGIEQATRQCEELVEEGVAGLHFYTLNKTHSTLEIVRNLGLSGNGGRPPAH
jgi:methylenetetrahydrofolate reductase (NADPH)